MVGGQGNPQGREGASLCGFCMRALVPHAALVVDKFPGGVEVLAGYE